MKVKVRVSCEVVYSEDVELPQGKIWDEVDNIDVEVDRAEPADAKADVGVRIVQINFKDGTHIDAKLSHDMYEVRSCSVETEDGKCESLYSIDQTREVGPVVLIPSLAAPLLSDYLDRRGVPTVDG
jgi:hypothetical protein